MKKRIAVILSICMAAFLFACSGKTSQEASESSAAEEITEAADTAAEEEIVGLANPITEYASMQEINDLTGGKLSVPEGAEVTNERFSTINAGDYMIAEYEFTIDGIPYCFRFANGITDDISGIYTDGGQLFADNTDDGNESKEFDGGKAARHFTLDGQYVLTAQDEGKLEMSDFEAFADALFDAAFTSNDGEKADGDKTADSGADVSFAGNYHEQIAGRGTMEVIEEGHTFTFNVRWPNSASEAYYWEFSGSVNEQGSIEYKNGVKYSIAFDDKGNDIRTELSETNSGTVSMNEDGSILWIDDESGNPDGSVFERD